MISYFIQIKLFFGILSFRCIELGVQDRTLMTFDLFRDQNKANVDLLQQQCTKYKFSSYIIIENYKCRVNSPPLIIPSHLTGQLEDLSSHKFKDRNISTEPFSVFSFLASRIEQIFRKETEY